MRRLWQGERGSQVIEYLMITPLAIMLLAAIIGQTTLAAMGLVACEAAARDAAVAAARGNDPVLAARQAAPNWNVAVSKPEEVKDGSYVGIKVSVSLTVPVLPLKFLPNQGFVITRSATMPKEKG